MRGSSVSIVSESGMIGLGPENEAEREVNVRD